MPDINDVYGGSGNLVSTKELKEGETMACKIKEARPEEIGGTTKLILDLENDKRFVLNKTNAQRLAKQFDTPDYTQWAGKEFKLVRSYTTFGGEEVPCLRVKRTEE